LADTTSVPTIDLGELSTRLEAAGVTGVEQLSGGASSLTYVAHRHGRKVVVKVAPPGLPPVLHRDVLRQARLVRALARSEVPVPEVLWEDEGAPPEVPPLFVMSFVEGSSVEPLFDLEGEPVEPGQMGARLHQAARTLAALHRVEPGGLGLTEDATGLPDEIARWSRLLETVDPEPVRGWPAARQRLEETAPRTLGPAVVHGDFRLGNLLALGPRITAVIDWEIWSLGDPRVDVGWFLLNADPETYARPTHYAGLTPTPGELAAEYTDALGVAPPDLTWFQALASFKSAATWSLIVKHNRRRAEPDAGLESMARDIPRLLARALELVDYEKRLFNG
jgi:aminoglycoside phosphotransferase (APT) family kinase protein